jgi:hypothetical protein
MFGTAPLAAPLSGLRRNEGQCARRCRAVVVGEPEREVDESGGNRAQNADDRHRVDVGRSVVADLDHDSAAPRSPEGDRDDVALLEAVREVRERAREGPCGDEGEDGREPGQG